MKKIFGNYSENKENRSKGEDLSINYCKHFAYNKKIRIDQLTTIIERLQNEKKTNDKELEILALSLIAIGIICFYLIFI